MNENTAKILSATVNAAVVQLPGRKFPGMVIQGDTLKILTGQADYLQEKLGDAADEEIVYTIKAMRDSLSARLVIYEKVLQENGIGLPY